MVVFFVMLVLIVQIGFIISTHSVVGAAVDATVRRVAVDAGDLAVQEARLKRDLAASIPGAEVEQVTLAIEGNSVAATVRYRWRPPGPDLAPLSMTVRRARAMVLRP